MTERTIHLTVKELSEIDGMPRFGSQQQEEMLALRKRSGIRYGVQVSKGRYDIVTTAFAVNKKGQPSGSSTVTIVKAGLLAADVVPAIKSIK